MRIIFFSILPFVLYFAETSASEDISAYRQLNTDYSVYEQKIIKKHTRSPLALARLYDEEHIGNVMDWISLELMQARFEEMRDYRFLVWRSQPNKRRRISWNYPDNGCYARASLSIKNFMLQALPVPNKIFVFGNLRVKTRNSPRGVVGWWYHVAPIVEVMGVKYVLDPSINRKRPLQLNEWLKKMGRPEKMKVAICESGTYSPKDNCDKESDGVESRAKRAQQIFLGKEWNRMVSLGRENEL